MTGIQVAPGGRIDNFIPPEGVPITFNLASRGSRLGAQILDILITYGSVTLFIILVYWSGLMGGAPLTALFLLLTFFIRIPYYIVAELVWNGRTLGKRINTIRVISANGRRLTPHQVVARNLMKEVEVFMPITTLFAAQDLNTWAGLVIAVWMVLVLLVPFFNRKRQRLGDMIADTLVVDMPKAVLMRDLSDSAKSTERQFVFNPEHLEVYGQYELQVLEAILREPPKSQDGYDRVRKVTKTIIRKIGYTDPVPQIDEWKFLLEFYKQQRGFLENRHLFGDSRQDKFHADEGKRSQPEAAKPAKSDAARPRRSRPPRRSE
ncbi:RDD family protein [Hoeflea poritis]|uniref:RDD family protein n=1 Tax=Hoeflea poritis TaxID=2993659 RepID=A0ABT4VUG0_9HYPH|nr:RDD family protein [Hoeflea poritis]MDA4848336.1 RDD family protein [Hoeflea poritis]